MSSHHFVKEQQEPAVFILEVEGISFETVAPLLEWSPTLLVAQEAVEVVLSWGIKIDVVLGTLEFQSENRHLLEEQYPLRFLTVSSESALEEGIHYLLASQHKGVHLVGFDHQNTSNWRKRSFIWILPWWMGIGNTIRSKEESFPNGLLLLKSAFWLPKISRWSCRMLRDPCFFRCST